MSLRLAIIGCGQISRQYGEHLRNYADDLKLVAAVDLDPARAAEFCATYGGRPGADLEAVLADPEVDAVVNLTVHRAHYEINARALRARKHVYSEKPLTLTYAEAQELITLARENGVRLAAAPCTFLGEGVQTAARLLEAGPIGPLRLVYAEVNWGQINRWIAAPHSYFTVGSLPDVGIYAITAMAALLGPVRSVWGYSALLQKERVGKTGEPFPVTAPDFTTGMLEFENGVVARLTTNYYVPNRGMPHLLGLEFHGDEGSIRLSDYHCFDATCHWHPYAQPGKPVPLLREGAPRMDRALGLLDLAHAIRDGRPHRTSAELAAHGVEVIEALQRSWQEKKIVEICSRFEKPPLMDWAREAPLHLPSL